MTEDVVDAATDADNGLDELSLKADMEAFKVRGVWLGTL